jgi:hypothetical protein
MEKTMNFNYFRWLVLVRQNLAALNYLAYKDKKAYRARPFNQRIKLCPKSWFHFYESGYTPRQAVSDDLELPWIEYKKHIICY